MTTLLKKCVIIGATCSIVTICCMVAIANRSPKAADAEQLTAAASRRSALGVARLLALGVDPNGLDRDGRTPLQCAAGSGSMMIVRMLFAAGANVRARSPDGYSVLHAVAVGPNVSLAKLLLAKGADVNARTTKGVTPLMATVGSPYSDSEMALIFIRAGADIKAVDSEGESVLCIAVVGKSSAVVEELLKRGADPNIRSKSIGFPGYTPLHMAALNGLTKTAALLLQYGADPSAHNDEGQTPLDITNVKFEEVRNILTKAVQSRTDPKLSG